jgi:hypothetical protein
LESYQSGLLHNPATAWIKNDQVGQEKLKAMDLFSQGKAAMRLNAYKGLDIFYNFEKSSSPLYDFPNLPKSDFSRFFDVIIQEEVQAVMDGKQDIDTAQRNIQQREQSNLDKANAK